MKTYCKKYPTDKALPNEAVKCSLCGGDCLTQWTLEDCANGGKVVLMVDENGKEQGRVQIYPEANAQRIVKAVNMHDELVNALKLAKKVIDRLCDEYSKEVKPYKHPPYSVAEDRQITNALKQA